MRVVDRRAGLGVGGAWKKGFLRPGGLRVAPEGVGGAPLGGQRIDMLDAARTDAKQFRWHTWAERARMPAWTDTNAGWQQICCQPVLDLCARGDLNPSNQQLCWFRVFDRIER